MPFSPFIGDPSAILGASSPSLGAPAISVGASWDQHPFLDVMLADGTHIPNAMTATITYGLDITVSTATVELATNPSLPNNTEIIIVAGAGTNNVRRFRGLYKEQQSVMWPHTFTMSLEGMLSRAARYQQSRGIGLPSFINQKLPVTGLPLSDLLNGSDPTDQNIIVAVLNYVPGLSVDAADIGGTGKLFGRFAWRDLAWQPYQFALDYIQNLDKVCLGWRLFENPFRIMRSQVFGYPNDAADYSFTEGVDIWDATGGRSIRNLFNAMYVEGYPVGGNPGLLYSFLAEDNDFQSADDPVTETFSSPLIEGVNGDTTYLTPDDVATWKLTEGNREQSNIDLVTFRDDLLFCGRTIAVNIPHAAVTEPVWMRQVVLHVQNEPAMFTQRILGKGGGTPGSYTPPPLD